MVAQINNTPHCSASCSHPKNLGMALKILTISVLSHNQLAGYSVHDSDFLALLYVTWVLEISELTCSILPSLRN